MVITVVPLLRAQYELYALPLGWERFQRYLQLLLRDDRQEAEFPPLVLLNPMGKAHVLEVVGRLLSIAAEEIAAMAAQDASTRLGGIDAGLKLGLVAVDDAQGGWTNRYFTDVSLRFDAVAQLKRGWVTVPCWTSDVPAAKRVREETLAAIYRALYLRRHGRPATLAGMMRQEGNAARFTGLKSLGIAAPVLAACRDIIAPRVDSSAFPVQFACLYGDEAATEAGYPPLGLPRNAGFAVALDDALQCPALPEAALTAHPQPAR